MTDLISEELHELEATVERALGSDRSAQVPELLDGLGWRELLDDPLAPATRTVARGACNAGGLHGVASPVLHAWILAAIGKAGGSTVPADGAVALPRRSGATALVLPNGGPGPLATFDFERQHVRLLPRGGMQVSALHPIADGVDVHIVDTGARPSDVVLGDRAVWELAEAMIRVCLAQEVAGACRAALDLAIDHVSSRRQFGRPLGEFQAVQHQLAEAHVWWSALDTTCRDGFTTTSTQGMIRLAPAITRISQLAGTAVSAATQQVHGAIGFTEEYPLHHHLKRILLVDGMIRGARFINTFEVPSSDALWDLLEVVRP